jgi:hypothetical protein
MDTGPRRWSIFDSKHYHLRRILQDQGFKPG